MSVLLPRPEGGEPLLLKGYIDLSLLQDPDTGEIRVRDWKSGSNLGLDPAQLTLYGIMVKQMFNVPCHYGEFGWLRAKDLENVLKPWHLDPMYDVVPQMVFQAERGIRSGVFDIRPSMLCKSCGVRGSCAWGKTLPPEELADD